MSEVEKLILRLCPNGVKYLPLAKVIQINFGERITKLENLGTEYPVYGGGGVSFYTDSYNREDEYVISRFAMSKSCVRKVEGKFWLMDSGLSFSTLSAEINRDYVGHFMFENQEVIWSCATQSGQRNLKTDEFKEIRIPIPPLEIQVEIVRILDKFTELQTELETELEARKLQFKKYRDEAMSELDDSNANLMSLSECAGIFDGTHQTPTYASEGVRFVSVENIDSLSTSTKFVSQNDFESLYKTKPQKGDLLMTRIGSVGRCAVIHTDEPLAYYVSLALIKPQADLITSSFIKHFLESHSGRIELDKRTLHHAVPLKINLGDLGKVLIRVPDLVTQAKLTNMFDKFEALLYSNNSGISTELFSRRQQFEHYRNKLLSFKELVVA